MNDSKEEDVVVSTTPTEDTRDDFDVLNNFREEWRRELGQKTGQDRSTDDDRKEYYDDDLHSQARNYFLQGVKHEEDGKLYDAIKFYKKAVALVPDIEQESFLYTDRQFRDRSSGSHEAGEVDVEAVEDQEAEDEVGNLLDRFYRLRVENQAIQPDIPTQGKHIGDLPAEVLNYILKWVVSADLDLRSLESCAGVCRGFFIAARDEEIWRLVCVRVWGSGVGMSRQQPWRDLFISRPRVHFNGCYISKISYIREGERGFQDHNYRAWHMVQYFRFIRLFPGGRVLMSISADDPGLTAKLMNNRNFCSVQGSMYGEYRIVDNILVCVLHKNKPKKIVPKYRGKKRLDSVVYYDVPDQDFLVEFTIKGSRCRSLHWRTYKIVNKYSNGTETVDTVSLADSSYPRLNFTRVGSYHFESTSPL